MKKFLNVAGILIATIISILMFILEIILVFNLIINSFVTKDNISDIIQKLMTYNNQNRETIITFASEQTFGNNITYNDDIKINYASIKGKIKNYLENAGFTEKEAEEIIQDDEFKSIVNNYLESAILNQIKDSEIKYPTKEEIKSFVKKNYKSLKKIKAVSRYTEANIDEFVEDNYEDVKEKFDEVREEIKIPELKESEILKDIINFNPITISIFIILAIVLLMLSRKSLYKWLIWVSVPTILNGILFSALGLFGIQLITSLIDAEKFNDIIDPIAKKMSTLMVEYGLGSMIIAIVMFIFYLIINSKIKKKA